METATKVKKTNSKKRADLIKYLQKDWVSEEKVELIHDLLNMGCPNLEKVLEIGGYDTNQCFDSAYPCDYAKRISEILPDFDNGWNFYDYSKETFGQMTNAYNLFAKRIIKTFSSW